MKDEGLGSRALVVFSGGGDTLSVTKGREANSVCLDSRAYGGDNI